MAYLDLVNELTGTLPGLSPILAGTYITRAYRYILDRRQWSFLVTDAVVNCPTMITTGTVSITQYASTITLDADASAAVLPQTIANAVPGILQMQIRFGSSPQLGGVYSIIAFDDTTPTALALLLDRVVQEATDPTSNYQFYRAYVTPPMDDFLKWECMVDIANYIDIADPRINLKSSNFDARDPQRTSQGLAYYLGAWGGNRIGNPITGTTVPNNTVDAGTPIYELWPHPTSGQTFICRIHRRGVDLTSPLDEPLNMITDELIMSRALGWHAYPFAMANVQNFPQMKGANWPFLLATAKANFKEGYTNAMKNDNAQALQDVWNRGHGLRSQFGGMPAVPIDAQYIQSHLLNF